MAARTRTRSARPPHRAPPVHGRRPESARWRLADHRGLVLGLLILAATGVRVTYGLELNATPFVELQTWRQTDMHYYDAWARTIAAGDWRSAAVDVPMHRWHHDVATQYFTTHPGARERLEAGATRGGAVDADTLLWRQWMRVPQFYQDPLYAYALAVTYRVLGGSVRYVFLWQLAAGILTVALVWRLAMRYFDDRVAIVAGTLAVLCGPLVYYELLLLRDSLIACAGLLLVWLTDRALSRSSWVGFALLGVTFGLCLLLKSTFLLLGVALVPWLYLKIRRVGRGPAVPAIAIAAGVLIAVAPVMARNVAVGATPWALASSGGLTFASANDPSYLPEVGFGIDVPMLAAVLGDTDGRSGPAVLETLRRHTPRSYLTLLWHKWDRVWHWYEIPNNENFYYLRTQVGILARLPVTFWFLGPLSLVGLVLARRRLFDAWPLYALVTTSVVSMVIFYVLGRFRVALLVALLPFAAHTLVELSTAVAERRYARSLLLAACVTTVMVWTGRPLGTHQVLIRMADWILPYSAYYQPLVYGALDAQDLPRAGAWYLEFFARYEPDDATIIAADDPRLGPELADMHSECAGVLQASGQLALAQAQRAQAAHLLQLPHLQ